MIWMIANDKRSYLSLPVLKRVAAQPVEFLEATLLVESVSSRVVPIDVPEETFKFSHFVFPDVFPDLEHREV